MQGPRVGLVTAAQAVDLDDDAGPLRSALARRGVDASLVIWDDPAVDWDAFDLVVLRSTWDYPWRHEEFLAWAAAVDRDGRLRNPATVVAWNTDKRYLADLAGAGVPTVPSAVHAPGDDPTLPADGPFVVKPAVSAGAQDTRRYRPDQVADARAHAVALHAGGRAVLVQPYVAAVDQRGETGVVHLADRYSHAIRKGPILRGRAATIGGLYAEEEITARTPSASERAVAERALDALPTDRSDLLYARVDLVPGDDGPLVLEVELVEPSLFLQHADGAVDRFADAISAAARP